MQKDCDNVTNVPYDSSQTDSQKPNFFTPTEAPYNLEEKSESIEYNANHVLFMKGSELNLAYFQKNGFVKPIIIQDKSGIGLRVPSQNFTVIDVKACVGSLRMLNVVDSDTNSTFIMMMKDWIDYYMRADTSNKRLCVTSLEFTHTKLSTYVEPPLVIQQMDWANSVWPLHLRESQGADEANIAPDRSKQPKVQKFCAMTVIKGFSEFHIDMGGASTWFHILHGLKVFWVIPPTEKNLQLFENWYKSEKKKFFADLVSDSQKFVLAEGETLILPSGWIHAIYSLKSSLAFSGNFLHCFSIKNQLTISEMERSLIGKFRYPYFIEMMWYVVKRYCGALLNPPLLNQKDKDEEKKSDDCEKTDNSKNIDKEQKEIIIKEEKDKDVKQKLTPYEYEGLGALLDWLDKTPIASTRVPLEFHNSQLLLRKLRELLDNHRNDPHDSSITNEPILNWSFNKRPRPASRIATGHKRKAQRASLSCNQTEAVSNPSIIERAKSGPQHRRVRCKKCEPCTRSDCGECHFCRDMKKFGGMGRMKQTCVSRQCMIPLLPSTAVCTLCESGDGREAPPCLDDISEATDLLMECTFCWKIVHPRCLQSHNSKLPSGILCDDLPASWKCPECIESEGNPNYCHVERKKPPVLSPMVTSHPVTKPSHKIKTTPKTAMILTFNEYLKCLSTMKSEKNENYKEDENDQLSPVRPGPISNDQSSEKLLLKNDLNHILEKKIWQNVFSYLDKTSLVNVMCTCKTFCKWSIDQRFWSIVDVSGKSINSIVLCGIVRRQPLALNISSSNITRLQLEWLLTRILTVEHLFLSSNSISTCLALKSLSLNNIRTLDLSWIDCMNDDSLRMIIDPMNDTTSLRLVSGLALNGTDITDASLRKIIDRMNILVKLELAYCANISDECLGELEDADLLSHIVLTGCPNISDRILDSITSVESLTIVEVNYCKAVTVSACHAAMRCLRQDEEKCVTICCGQNESPYARLIDMIPELVDN